MSMQIDVVKSDDNSTRLFVLKGVMDKTAGEELLNLLLEYKQKISIIDCEQITNISSDGIRALLLIREELRALSKEFYLSNVNQSLDEIFNSLGINLTI